MEEERAVGAERAGDGLDRGVLRVDSGKGRESQ